MIGSKLNKQVLNVCQNAFRAKNCTKLIPCTRALSTQKSLITKPALSNTIFTNSIKCISTSQIVYQQNTPGGATDLFHVEDRRDEGYVILQMNKAPVNSLSLEFLTALNIQMDKLEKDKSVKGIILTSALPNIFSAGLDIMEMYDCKPERIRNFWSELQNFWIKLYGSSKVTVAAINGHSPAGGCLMATCCDYRVMAAGPYKIGLNETKLGIVAPFWFKDTLINTVGHRETEKALQLGTLYSGEHALKVGLIDELVAPADVITKAKEQMKIWLQIPTTARQLTKNSMRQETISLLISQKENDIENFASYTTKDSIQKSLGAYLQSLKKPKKN